MERSIFVRTLIGCLLLTLAIPAAAGQNRWTFTGPEGAEIAALLVPPSDPATIFAVTTDGTLFRSATAGEPSWTAVSSSLPALESRGVPMSDSSLGRLVLAAHPDDTTRLYAAVTHPGARSRLFRSTNAGATWIESAESVNGDARSLTFAAEEGYLATSAGLFVTVDGGRSWRPTSLGRSAYGTVIGPSGTLYVTTSDGVFATSDRGETWTARQPFFATSLVRTAAGDVMFALSDVVVLYSRDSFATWQHLPFLPSRGTLLTVSDSGDRVYVATAKGVVVYDPFTARWLPAGCACDIPNPTALVFARGVDRLFAGETTGVLAMATRDGTSGWRNVSQGIRSAVPVRSIAVARNGDVHAATARGLSKSTDGGESWQNIPGIADASWVTSGENATYVADAAGIHRTLDGETWTAVSPNKATWLGMSSMSAATLYAIWDDSISRSQDGGRIWRDITPSTPMATYLSGAAVDPTDSERVYVGYINGLARSDQGGSDWRLKFTEANEFSALAVNGSVVHAAVACSNSPWDDYLGCGVTTSLDGGTNWSALRLSDGDIRSLAIDPARPWRSYAGTASGRVYRSDDFGNEWAPFGEGLSGGSVRHLAISSDGDRIYAGTAGGVFVYQIAPEESVFELLPADPQRLPRLMDQLLATQGGSTASSASGLLIPAAGRVRGSSGVTFHTDVTLANGRATEQDVFVAWLPQGNPAGANVSTFRLTLPAAAGNDDGALTLDDLADDLGLDGLGSLLVFAVDGAGNVDTDAEIDGFARIRSRSECGGWVSQSLAAVPADAFTTAQRSQVIGLRHEASYRTNIGVVNLSASSRDFTVIARGEGATEQFTITVPSFAPVLAAIPNRNYGAVTLTVIGNGASAPSVSYGSSVDNASGDAWAAVARPRRTP